MSSTIPWLPVEIAAGIISEAWNSQLSTTERIAFMTSSLAVSKIWTAIFLRISFRDVHIPCPSYSRQYLRILRNESSLSNIIAGFFADHLAKSLTFHLEHNPVNPDPIQSLVDKSQVQALHDTLQFIKSSVHLPNLRRVSIEHINWTFDDLLTTASLATLPLQVTDLDISYTFAPETPAFLVDALRSSYTTPPPATWALPSISSLSVLGAGSALVTDILLLCPAIMVVTTDAFRPYDAAADACEELVFMVPSEEVMREEALDTIEWVLSLEQRMFTVSAGEVDWFGYLGPEDGEMEEYFRRLI